MSFKSLLNWLDGDEPEKKREKTQASDWTEKRRDNRLDLDENAKPLTVHLMSEEGNEAKTLVAVVKNVSVRGCGLLFESAADRARLSPKQILVASLAVEDFPIPLQVEVARLIGDKEAAIRFKPPFPRELDKLEKFLEPKCLGRSLREIDQQKLQKEQQKGLRWFQGVNETNLFSWVHPQTGRVNQQQLLFLDRVVEWKEEAGIKTGVVRQDENAAQGGIGWVRSELLDFDSVPDSSVLHQAKLLMESAKIEESVRRIFLEKLP